jgi:hypothetical protein
MRMAIIKQFDEDSRNTDIETIFVLASDQTATGRSMKWLRQDSRKRVRR